MLSSHLTAMYLTPWMVLATRYSLQISDDDLSFNGDTIRLTLVIVDN